MRRFLTSSAVNAKITRSEAVAQSATTLARQEKERLRAAALELKQIQPSLGPAGLVSATEGVREKAVLLNRKTGQPLYSPQAVISSAHLFRECKKTGAPMPKVTAPSAHSTGSTSSYMASGALVLAVGAIVSYVASGPAQSESRTSTSTAHPVLVASEIIGSPFILSSASIISDAEKEVEAERQTILRQQPLWLQRQR